MVCKKIVVPKRDPHSTERRRKLPNGILKCLNAIEGRHLYFYRRDSMVVVTTSQSAEERPLFRITVNYKDRSRLSESNLKKVGANFEDALEFSFIDRDTSIVRVLRQKANRIEQRNIPQLPEEVEYSPKYIEGATRQIIVNAFERNQKARQACINYYGLNCHVCNFNFEQFYGDIGRDFINVHHLKPISSIGEEYELDPIKDLRPVCPNCHAMIHSKRPPYSIEELRRRLKDKFTAIR